MLINATIRQTRSVSAASADIDVNRRAVEIGRWAGNVLHRAHIVARVIAEPALRQAAEIIKSVL